MEECDESLGWIEILIENSIGPVEEWRVLLREADELVSIFVKSHKTAERNYEAELARQRAAHQRKSQIRRKV